MVFGNCLASVRYICGENYPAKPEYMQYRNRKVILNKKFLLASITRFKSR